MSSPASKPAVIVLDEGFTPGFSPLLDIGDRWKELPHAPTRSRGFVLIPGEGLRTDPFLVDSEHTLYVLMMRAVERLSADGLDLRVGLEIDAAEVDLAIVHMDNMQDAGEAAELRLSLRPYAGRFARLLLQCRPGAQGLSDGDWLALLACVLAPSDALPEAVAHSQFAWRLANESSHFTEVYNDSLYSEEGACDTGGRVVSLSSVPSHKASVSLSRPSPEDFLRVLAEVEPISGESAFAYAHRLLAREIASPNIDFSARLLALSAEGEANRLLSLCAGEARVEAEILRRASVRPEVTLLDLNETLLRRAASRFPCCPLRLWKGRVEDLGGVDERFDIICFVSGLHHVPDLERVLQLVADRLSPAGELWLIGEQIGRNGNRLWPDAQRVADALFRRLPERLRRNHSTGRIDVRLPDVDYGSSGFEGVRSQDIPDVLSRFFHPLVEDRRNCFLWRFMEPAYHANYEMGRADDVAVIQRLVAEELAFYTAGGATCELNGAYRKRSCRVTAAGD